MSMDDATPKEYEQVVFSEVLIPDVTDAYGDFYTKAGVRAFAYEFMKQGFGIDVNHSENDQSDSLKIVESFIAREGDPDFIEGAWVVGLYVGDDDLWAEVLQGNLTGFSYQANIYKYDVGLVVPSDNVRVGVTEPDLGDGHTHSFFVILGVDGRPIAGGTSIVEGHAHPIRRHTLTEESAGHVHIYNYVEGNEGR